ncbi:MAG: VWA domain-containing protein [Deltaproteobacteria bacterium]|jgi:uncharacterized protein YegL|nr:VWA domain-containing protein [Deltaproteobacteria bacterium]
MRRLPIYLLLDVSGSMTGPPLQFVETGFATLLKALKKDPQAVEMAYLSLITFESAAKQVFPLTEVISVQPQKFTAGGGTSLGAALNLALTCANNEVVKNTPAAKGDFKPLIFIMTDGMPTDDIHARLRAFKSYNWGTIVACAAGEDADVDVLTEIAGENVLILKACDERSMAAFFKFLSTSIVATSKRVDLEKTSNNLADLGPLPPEISLLKS